MADKWTPDILACINGKFIGIEVKRDQKEVEKRAKQKDKRATDQMKQGQGIMNAGWLFFVVSSTDELERDLADNNII